MTKQSQEIRGLLRSARNDNVMTFNVFALTVIFLFNLIIFTSNIARGQPYRDGLSVPPTQIFNGILDFTKSGDYEKIDKAVQALTPLLTAYFQKYGSDHASEIRSAISAKDKDRVLKGIQRLIFSDIKDLFDQAYLAIRESNEKAKVKFKTAFLDYLLLAPYIETRNFQSDGKIKRGFRDIQFTIDSSAPYGTSGPSAISPDAIKKISDEIVRELQSVMPELK